MSEDAGRGRTLVIAVDGFGPQDAEEITAGMPATAHPRLLEAVPGPVQSLTILPGGPSEPVPALVSLSTGASVAHTGVATEIPFEPGSPESRPTWYANSLLAPTLFDQAREQGLVTAALQWPATAGAEIDLCLPLVEDLRHYRNRWEMTEATSSPRMVREHLAPRRAAGVQLSQVPADALVAEIAAEACASGRIDLLAVRLTSLGAARREHGPTSPRARRALDDVVETIEQVVLAFAPTAQDRLLLMPGRALVPTALLVHPNAALAQQGLMRTDGTRLVDFRALVWPDGPRGALHVRRDEGEAVHHLALDALAEIAAHSRLEMRRVDDGVGATAQTDVIAVLEGGPGTVFGLSATHRPLVEGDDPYYAGPRAVTDPSRPTVALASGPGLPTAEAEGGWADLGVTLAGAMGLRLPGATATGMRPCEQQPI